MLADAIRKSFIIVEDDPLNIILVKDVIENKQHPFRKTGKPDITVYLSESVSMFRKWAHLPQHLLTNPFFIETKTYGKTREGVNQGNMYKYIEGGDRERKKSQIDRKYGDFRMIVADPEMFELHTQEGSEIQARELETHNLWKTGLGCIYRLHASSEILHATFNGQDVIDFAPLEYLRKYPEVAWKIRNKNPRFWNSRIYYGDVNQIFGEVAQELERND